MDNNVYAFPLDTVERESGDELFPMIDADILPIQNPLRIARPMRFGTKRENAVISNEAVRRLLEINSSLLAYLTLKQWSELVNGSLELLKDAAHDDFVRFFSAPADVHGVNVSTRAFSSSWVYPAEIGQLEQEVQRAQDQLRRAKKAAEADGTARRVKGEGRSLVVTFRP